MFRCIRPLHTWGEGHVRWLSWAIPFCNVVSMWTYSHLTPCSLHSEVLLHHLLTYIFRTHFGHQLNLCKWESVWQVNLATHFYSLFTSIFSSHLRLEMVHRHYGTFWKNNSKSSFRLYLDREIHSRSSGMVIMSSGWLLHSSALLIFHTWTQRFHICFSLYPSSTNTSWRSMAGNNRKMILILASLISQQASAFCG